MAYEGTIGSNVTPIDQFTAVGLQARDSLSYFAHEILNVTPDYQQEKILNDISKYSRIAAHTGHGIGKTTIGSWTLLWFLFTRPHSKVITTAPTWRQVKDLLWTEVHKWARQMELEKMGWTFPYDLQKTRLNIQEEWYATGEATDDPIKLEGYHAPSILYLIDEAKGVPDGNFDSIEGGMTAREAKMIMLSTPGGTLGKFYQVCKGKENVDVDVRDRDFWHISHLSAEDSPQVSDHWITGRKRAWGEFSGLYRLRVKGEFVDTADDTLIPASWIDAALERSYLDRKKKSRIIAVDVARYGGDNTVICRREGFNILPLEKMEKSSVVEVANRVVAADRDFNASEIWVDETGVGGGVVDLLLRNRRVRARVHGFNGGAAALDEDQFLNRRVEVYWHLRDRFEQGEITLPDDDTLATQLGSMRYKYHVRGEKTLLQLESKEDARKKGLPSPDEADAICMSFASDAVPLFEGSGVYF